MRHIGAAPEAELAAVVEVAGGALVAVLGVDVVDVVVDVGEAGAVTVRVTVAVGATAE